MQITKWKGKPMQNEFIEIVENDTVRGKAMLMMLDMGLQTHSHLRQSSVANLFASLVWELGGN